MGRKNPIACVYMLRNTANDKIYIGETVNYVDRMSYYKGTKRRVDAKQVNPRPIDIAICEYGWDVFKPIILVEKGMDDTNKRKRTETMFIRAFRSYEPEIGYNVSKDLCVMNARHRRTGFKTKVSTKILKSNPIISYNYETEEMFMWLGSKSFADYLGIDRSQVARPLKNGNLVHGYYVFPLDKETRDKYARATIERKYGSDFFDIECAPYAKAYKAVTKFAKMWGC